jgi:protein TonB
MRPGSTFKGWRVRGAIAWKLVLGIAVAAAVVWVLAQPSVPPPEPGSRAVAGPIAVRTPVPNTERPTAPPPAAAPPAAVVATGSPSDPFAGVDVSNNSVLRHIAGIEEKARGRRAAQARDPLRVNPAATATPPARQPVAPQPPREQPAAESRPVAPPGGVQLVAALGLPDVPRTAATPPTVPLAEVPLARPVTESAAASAPAAERAATPVPASPAANPAPGDRVLVAALGKSAPPQSTTPPLRVARRTVPVFPVEAMRAGIQNGRVVARLTIEADGRVSAAQIINSNPIGYFERESRRALATWRYDPPGQPTSADVELIFTRE